MIKIYSIPAFFAAALLLISCTSSERKTETLSNLSAGFEDEVSLMKMDEVVPEKKKAPVKPAEVKKEIPKIPEPVQFEDEKEAIVEKAPDIKEQPEFIKIFNARYLNFDVADFFLQLKQVGKEDDAVKYQMRMFVKSNSFIDYMFGWRDHTISRFRETKDRFVPEFYKTKLLFKKKIREINTAYDKDGVKVVTDVVNPPDNRDKRPAVPDDMKSHTYDPLVIAMEARRMIIRAVKDNNFTAKGNYNFSLPMYDGRRRTDLMFSLSNKKVDGNYALKLSRKPVSGFTNNELTDIGKGDVTIDIYLDPENFIPVSAEGRNFLGTAALSFVKDCKKTFEECVDSIKKD